MTTKQFMAQRGQHQSSVQIRKFIDQGKQITNLWTNGEQADQGLSIVEIGGARHSPVTRANHQRNDND